MKKLVLTFIVLNIAFMCLYSQSPHPRILGVVMGISKYQNVPSLKYADRDAMLFYNFLLSPAGGGADTNNIRLLLNEKATSYNFFEAMDNLLDMAKEGDQVYIYFAGHGDIEKKTERQNGFLIGSNAPANCYAAGGCISVRFLQDYVETLVSKNKSKVTMIIDACRSGKLAGGSQGAEVTALALQTEWKGVTKILSCQPGETSLEGEQWGGGGGVFTYFMLKGMLGQADKDGDGKVSGLELNHFLDENVPKETNNKQLPEVVGDRRQEITHVDRVHALALLNQMEKPITLPREKESAGFEADVSSINDISLLKQYEKFKYYINSDNLIAHDDADSSKETALSIFSLLEKSYSDQPIIAKLRREIVAALQNKTQTITNAFIESSSIENFEYRYAAYQELNAAFNLCDSTDPQYNQLKYRYLFWNSVNEKDSLKEIKKLEECINLNPDEAIAYLQLGAVYNNKFNNKEKALSYYDKALKLSNNWSIAWCNKGIALANIGKNEEAIKCHDKAIELKPDNEGAWASKGFALLNLEKYDDALKCLNKAIEIQPDKYSPWYNKGIVFAKIKNHEEAMKSFNKASEIDSTNIELWLSMAHELIDMGKPEEALYCLNKAIEIKPSDDTTWYQKGNLYKNLGHYDESIVCYDSVIVINRNFYEAWVHKGMSLDAKGKEEEAIKCYDFAIEINPNRIEAWINRGYTLNHLGKYHDALICLDKSTEINPQTRETWTNKSISYLNLGRFEEAMNCVEKEFEIDPNDYNAWFDKGNVFYYWDKPDEAIKCYDKVLELNPKIEKVMLNKGNILLSLRRSDEALICFNKLIELNPLFPEAWTGKGYCLQGLGKNNEALKCYDKAIELNPQNIQAWLQKGIGLHMYQKKYEEAIICYKKVLELNPNEVLANYNLSCAYSLLKNKQEMLKYLKKTMELNPKKYRVDAPKDEDFKEYWNDPEFLELVR